MNFSCDMSFCVCECRTDSDGGNLLLKVTKPAVASVGACVVPVAWKEKKEKLFS